MQAANFIVREPLLSSQERVLGYELTWQRNGVAAYQLDETNANALVNLIGGQDNEIDVVNSDQVLFMEAHPALLKADVYSLLPKHRTILALRTADLVDGDAVAAARAMRVRGYGISLRDADLAKVDQSLLSLFSHVELSIDAADFDKQMQLYRSLELTALPLIARNVRDWDQYDRCAALGMDAFVGNLHLSPRPDERARDLNPAQTMIVQLMDMVKKGEDVRQLEGILKRDAALSYKLLRYINSAGFGLGCEIQSLRHAVTLLGYSPLYRWLALLLVTATNTDSSPVLLQTAVIRGRFAELLGQAFLPRNEAENLFVAGMFSLLDRLLGIPMELVLEKVPLSGPVTEALLAREGIYGPFLALAEACEVNTAEVESMTTALCISPKDVNVAHLSALAWVQNLRL